MSNTVIEALEKYTALLSLEQTTGNKTTRARNAVVKTLSDEDLADFAVALKRSGSHAGNLR